MRQIETQPPRPAALRVPQLRVLQILAALEDGLSMTRAKLSEVCGNRTGVVVGRAVGYSDPDKRRVFEETKDGGGSPGKPCPSLLTLGYVSEKTVPLDGGIVEVHIQITADGRRALAEQGDVQLPPIRDSYRATRDQPPPPSH